jgi:hypothetical protein
LTGTLKSTRRNSRLPPIDRSRIDFGRLDMKAPCE